MTDKDSLADANAVFLPEQERKDAHIVDVLIEERCPSFASHWSWPVLRPILYGALGYKRAVSMADHIETLTGPEAFDHLTEDLEIDVSLRFADRMPKEGKLILVVNHPTGLADGVALWSAVTQVRKDINIFANADAIRVSEKLAETIIPVEWVLNKRSPAKAKETLRRAKQAFDNGECVVIFPSGKLAGREKGDMVERPWMPTAVTLARKQKCPVLPVNIQAENSWLYYFLSGLNGELRDITLFYELLNKKRAEFDITFGPLIQPDDLGGDVQEVTEMLKSYVAYSLHDAPDEAFADWRKREGPVVTSPDP